MELPYKSAFRITSPYGVRTDPITGEVGIFHSGLDLVGEDKTVCAIRGGTVLVSQIVTDPADRTWEWGNYVAIAGDDGYVIYYCHLAERWVKAGDTVTAGTPIGVEGATGRVTGSHLHLEVRRNNAPLSPADYLGILNAVGELAPVHGDSVPSSWAEEGVRFARENGILLGDERGNLRLRDPCTREEMAVMLHRLAKILIK